MYFFLTQLALTDIFLITVILPNMLRIVLVVEAILQFHHCIAQFYFFGALEGMECFLLTVMSCDRYLAICKPLHYTMIMSHQNCLILVVTCWTLSFAILLIHPLIIVNLKFCGSNVIDHFFCDLDPILELSCSDTTILQLVVTSSSTLFVAIPFFLIIMSYVYIITTIFKIPSVTGRQKVFSTCSSHLTVVSLFYGTLSCVYLAPRKGQSGNITKYLSLLYTVGTPLINPIIYSLRNKDLKKVGRKLINKLLNFYFNTN
ncbi:olfactory receptor 10AG1-like [Hyperolius riggenbachi]|uniref:olfactory receptor 10AG1-like n=1 Tax=Hyperolius riggenbachi TaxID=752182 RepID=UPI0035A2F116